MATIFANGFEFGTDEDALRKHFSSVGAISDFYWQSRGSAVITYVKPSAAQRAVSELHESTMKGQSRYVAVKLDERGSGGKGKGKSSGGKGSGAKGGGKSSGGGGKSIFVKGFEFGTDESAMKRHFGKVGPIESLYFQSKGSCVVTFANGGAARRAVEEKDGSTMAGQSRYVDVKLDDPDRGQGESKGSAKGGKSSGKGSGKSSGKGSGGRGIYVSGFDFDTDETAMKRHFGKMGRIEDLYFQSKGACVVTFSDPSSAKRALNELQGSTMRGQSRYVSIKIDNPAHKNNSGKGWGKGKGKRK